MNNKNNKTDSVRPHKSYKSATAPEEQTQPRSFLADLFRESDDPLVAAAERAKRFGRTPMNNPDQKGSFL